MAKSKIIGIMTGTSLDAIDIAICDFFYNNDFKFELLYYQEYPFPNKYKEIINQILSRKVDIKLISQLNIYISELFCDYILKICNKSKININEIEAISIHGQTIWHNPSKEKFIDKFISSTLQLASISFISSKLSKKVIGDFRIADIAQNGQGAPLVPIFDYFFLRSSDENIISLNIGGISNITYLPKNCTKSDVIAFDCGPGNILIDSFVQEYLNLNFDYDGKLARNGKVIQELLDKLKKIKFIYETPPKSTGRELFNLQLINKLIKNNNYKYEDILCTLVEFTAYSIYYNTTKYITKKCKIIISGGGRKNKYLIERLKYYLPDSNLLLIDEIGINGDAKEAIFIAFLGFLNILNLSGNIKNVTGAKKEVVLGITAQNYKIM